MIVVEARPISTLQRSSEERNSLKFVHYVTSEYEYVNILVVLRLRVCEILIFIDKRPHCSAKALDRIPKNLEDKEKQMPNNFR